MMPVARCAALAALSASVLMSAQTSRSTFSVVEAGIAEMQAAMADGTATSRQIVEQYLARTERYDAMLKASLAINPRALGEADTLDRERAAGRIRGPLHGVPIGVKDNIHTPDMPTTGGALAFRGFVPPYEATLVRHLRAAGAIVVAKTGMTELANWVAGPPTPMPSGYNALHGFSFNPFDPRPLPRSDGRPLMDPGGSSSGVGTSANLWAANIGTETSGSILNPANNTMLAALKPTVGRISRHGVIPIVSDQDTPGPLAKSVRDLAILLGVLEGPSPDPNDGATSACTAPPGGDYTAFLQADALKGARIGVPRAYYYEAVDLREPSRRGGLRPDEARVMAEAIEVLRQRGAEVVDPANIPSIVAPSPSDNFLRWDACWGSQGRRRDEACSIVLKYGMKRDFNRWLQTLGPAAPVSSLTALREWNLAHRDEGALRYGQSSLDISDEMDVERDRARYEADRAKDLRLSRTEGIDAALGAHRLDALVFPGVDGADMAARAGYPTVMVPFGFVSNPSAAGAPQGLDARPQPFGVSFTGGACSEPRLLAIAYAFEQATKRRIPPAATP